MQPAAMTSTTIAPVADAPGDISIRPDPALVDRIKGEIQLSDSTHIATFGGEAQREVTSFADTILRETANRDSGPIGELINSMILSVNKLDADSLAMLRSSSACSAGSKARSSSSARSFSPWPAR
jgi:uncharacterized protein YaaN involved in tellurite resistance